MNHKQILLFGATGMVGRRLSIKLEESGYHVIGVSRGSRPSKKKGIHAWVHYQDDENLAKKISEVDGVVNLTGEAISQFFWTKKKKERFYDSRVGLSQKIQAWVENASSKPKVWVNASAIGYYGNRGDEALTEQSSPGVGYLASLCEAWEYASQSSIRNVQLRIGIVLSADGGAIPILKKLFNVFLGAAPGAKHWVSWIGLEDLVNIVMTCIENENLKGPVNAVTPTSVRSKVFYREIAKCLNRPLLPAPPFFLLKRIMGDQAAMFYSQKVVPEKLILSNHSFLVSNLKECLIKNLK